MTMLISDKIALRFFTKHRGIFSNDMTINPSGSYNNYEHVCTYGFSSGHVWMWELDYKESWALKNWCFWTVVLGKTLESPLDCKEIQPVHPKDQSCMFTGRTDVETETPILWPPDVKADSFEKTLMLGKIEDRRRRGRQGWDGWMASPTQRTWVWVNSGSWWWTGRPGVLRFMGLQRVGHDWATELNWTDAPNRALKYMKQRLTELRVEIDNSTIIIRDFNAVLSLLDGTTKEKINKKREDQNNNIYKLDLIHIHRTPNRSRMHIFFSQAYMKHST